ncbi:MAG: efflux RND transporter periplasmic adaptor subunit [Deltaproteobacteria bacterium]|nr:efflux RND transporter periplasmic adaptor subunit [Deltaproteobacteria bacterium]
MKKIAIVVSLAVILSATALYVLYHERMAGVKRTADPIHEADVHGEKEPTQPLLLDPASEADHPTEDHIPLTEAQIGTLGIAVAKAGPGRLQNHLNLQGEIILNGNRIAQVTPYVSGHVKEILKNLGDPVRRGEVMALLDSRELADAKAAYLAARERVVLAETRFAREENLWKKQIASEEDYLNAKQALAAAQIEKRSAKQQLMSLGLSATRVDRLPRRPDAGLTVYEIVSPLKGEVLERALTLGEMVGPERIVYRVGDMDTVWVRVNVYQKDLPLLKKNMKVLISGDDGKEARGSITYIAPVVDEGTRTAIALVTLQNPRGQWRPGRFVTAKIPLKAEALPVVIPKDAVQTLTDRPVVFVPSEEGFEARPVSLGRSDPERVEILSGLSAGDPYVAEGAFELKAAILSDSLGDHAGHGH